MISHVQEHGVINAEGKMLADPRSHECGKVAVQALKAEDPGFDWDRWQVRRSWS